MTERDCPTCATEQLFVTPPCEDGHGEDCLDLMCVVCGHALSSVALLLVEEVVQVDAAA